MQYALFWFRRDLRINDNHGLFKALTSGFKIIPLFIFDDYLFEQFSANNRKLNYIYDTLKQIHHKLNHKLLVVKGNPVKVIEEVILKYDIKSFYYNEDYEPYATKVDNELKKLFKKNNIPVYSFKDHVIFQKDEILNKKAKPYTIFTQYKKEWLKKINNIDLTTYKSENYIHNLADYTFPLPKKEELQIINNSYTIKPFKPENIVDYEKYRDFPYIDRTTNASVFLRYGVLSIRNLVKMAIEKNINYLNELIWREFFIQIMYHFPESINENFKKKFNQLQWQNNEYYWKCWTEGKTGFPLIDAGIRELLETGYMHNRIRMLVASFLSKILLIDWRWGESFFAQHLIDYDVSLNVGNWQWAAGTGCDSAPYFRIFNPTLQQKKFDPNFIYIKKWIKDFEIYIKTIKPIVNFDSARKMAIQNYYKLINNPY